MSDAPETIWAETRTCTVDGSGASRMLAMDREFRRSTEYRRVDMPLTTAQLMADPRVRALVDALRECEAEIDQYIRQEYFGDHPVQERYRQRDFGANPARIALAKLKEHIK